MPTPFAVEITYFFLLQISISYTYSLNGKRRLHSSLRFLLFRTNASICARPQPGACTLFVRTLTGLRREKTDAHVARFFKFHFIPPSPMPELCEAFLAKVPASFWTLQSATPLRPHLALAGQHAVDLGQHLRRLVRDGIVERQIVGCVVAGEVDGAFVDIGQ